MCVQFAYSCSCFSLSPSHGALTGLCVCFLSLLSPQLLVTSNEGEIVQPGAFKAVFDEGMPDWQRSFDKGKLFIHFHVKFPSEGDIGDEDVKVLEKVLGARPTPSVDMDSCEEVSAMDVDMEQEMRRQQQKQQENHDDDEDQGQAQQRVQCAQQ